LRVYLDTSALNRVFDDQSQARIYLESTSMELVFLMVENEAIEIVSSEALDFETRRNPYEARRVFVESVLQKATAYQVLNQEILDRAQELETTKIAKGLDALHLSCAEVLVVDYFITCDDRLTRRYSGSVRIRNPVQFVMNVTGSLSTEE
jgi:predicted nucleic acid-binding protein